MTDFTQLSKPFNDEAAEHLTNSKIPSITLLGTNNELINIAKLKGYVVLYCYPLTANPKTALPKNWDTIAGARGCTPQNCSYRDSYKEIVELGAQVYGFSTQTIDYQKEMALRLHLPQTILSDNELKFVNALKLPTFNVDSMTLVKRITLIIKDGVIEQVFYPIFPSTADVDLVISYLKKLN